MKALVNRLARSKALANFIFSAVLFMVKVVIGKTAKKSPTFAERLKERNLTVQIKLQDNSRGRYYILKDGVISSSKGIHPNPDVIVFFANAQVALDMLVPPRDQLKVVNAMKAFQLGMMGPDDLSTWFMEGPTGWEFCRTGRRRCNPSRAA